VHGYSAICHGDIAELLPDIDCLTGEGDLAHDFSVGDGGKGDRQEDLEQESHSGLGKIQKGSSDITYTNEELQELAKDLAFRLSHMESSVGNLRREKYSNVRQIAMLRRNLNS